jgi:hypothetical protein
MSMAKIVLQGLAAFLPGLLAQARFFWQLRHIPTAAHGID